MLQWKFNNDKYMYFIYVLLCIFFTESIMLTLSKIVHILLNIFEQKKKKKKKKK